MGAPAVPHAPPLPWGEGGVRGGPALHSRLPLRRQEAPLAFDDLAGKLYVGLAAG